MRCLILIVPQSSPSSLRLILGEGNPADGEDGFVLQRFLELYMPCGTFTLLEQFLSVRLDGRWEGGRGAAEAGLRVDPGRVGEAAGRLARRGPQARTRRPLPVAAPAFHRGRSMPQKKLGRCGGQALRQLARTQTATPEPARQAAPKFAAWPPMASRSAPTSTRPAHHASLKLHWPCRSRTSLSAAPKSGHSSIAGTRH